jgi:hypothetical protein
MTQSDQELPHGAIGRGKSTIARLLENWCDWSVTRSAGQRQQAPKDRVALQGGMAKPSFGKVDKHG